MSRSAPPNPVPLPDDPTIRFTPGVELDTRVLDRLRDVCSTVDTSESALVEEARDWWPLAMTWAAAGTAPARAAAVARPSTAQEVADVLRVCTEAGTPVTAAGGRSGVCGASIPVFGGVVLDTTAMAGITDVDDASLLAEARAGTFGDDLEEELRGNHAFTLGHWPQSIALSTLGGWLACRSAGQLSTRYGKIEDMVVGLEVALADGSLIRTGATAPRAAVGPDLTQLFVGSEGTLGVITEARLRVHRVPPAERRAAYGFASFAAGLEACRRILRRGATPAVLRLYDEAESKRNFETESNVLVVLDEADRVLVEAVMAVVDEECREARRLDPELVEQWLSHRNEVGALGALTSRGYVLDTVEIAARWSVLPGLYSEVVERLRTLPGNLAATAHQSHAYTDGACLYFTFAFAPDVDDREAVYRAAWDAVCGATLARDGALSHHHGVGLNRSRFMRDALGPSFSVLESVKRALDPAGVLNPGKLGLPSPFGDARWT